MKKTLKRHVYPSETIHELLSIWRDVSEILGKKSHYVKGIERLLALNSHNRQEQFKARYGEISQCFASAIRKWRLARSYLYDCKDCDISYIKHQGFLAETREMRAKIKDGDLSAMNTRTFAYFKRDMDTYWSHLQQK